MSAPKTKLTPLSFYVQPDIPFSGSAHSKSQSRPWSGISTGLTIFKICSKFYNCGLSPPCMQNIFSSIRAQTGMTLKTSEKIFHSFKLYFLLPNLADGYIRRRTHKFYWCSNTHGFPGAGKSSLGAWFYKPWASKCIRWTAFPDRRNPLRKGNWYRREIRHTRTVW